MISAHELIAAYSYGFFPMAHPEEGNTIYWHKPHMRGIIPLKHFHVSKNLKRLLHKGAFLYSINQAFDEVIQACAQREETWISDDIAEMYTQLNQLGLAHSFEVWHQGELAGGLYGVALKGAFFGESMFHRVTDASKLALSFLTDHLIDTGYSLLDTQFISDHLRQFGAIEVTSSEFELLLNEALLVEAHPIKNRSAGPWYPKHL